MPSAEELGTPSAEDLETPSAEELGIPSTEELGKKSSKFDTILVEMTREMGLWLQGYGYDKTTTWENDLCYVEISGLKEYGQMMYCLSEGYDVFDENAVDTETGISLTMCARENVGVQSTREVQEDTYDLLAAALPGDGGMGRLVPIHFTEKKFFWYKPTKGNMFDVVSPTRSERFRVRWEGSLPNVVSSLQFAEVL